MPVVERDDEGVVGGGEDLALGQRSLDLVARDHLLLVEHLHGVELRRRIGRIVQGRLLAHEVDATDVAATDQLDALERARADAVNRLVVVLVIERAALVLFQIVEHRGRSGRRWTAGHTLGELLVSRVAVLVLVVVLAVAVAVLVAMALGLVLARRRPQNGRRGRDERHGRRRQLARTAGR